jgi:hypothetical protein
MCVSEELRESRHSLAQERAGMYPAKYGGYAKLGWVRVSWLLDSPTFGGVQWRQERCRRNDNPRPVLS